MVPDENKAKLAEFLLHDMMSKTESLPNNCHLVVDGGFRDPDSAQTHSYDAEYLCVDHEKADT